MTRRILTILATLGLSAAAGGAFEVRENPGTNGSQTDQNVPMMRGTSPSITVDGSQTAVAFQGSDEELWTWLGTGGAGTAVDQHEAMIAGTSPSIGGYTVSPIQGDVSVAFEGINADLWMFLGPPNTFRLNGLFAQFDTGLGMARGTSPSLINPGGIADVAFQANTGILWTWAGSIDERLEGGGLSTGLAMAAGTSPSITDHTGPDQEDRDVAFQDPGGALSLWAGFPDGPTVGHAALFSMAAGTSPSITTVGDGQPAVAYQDNGFLVTGLGTADDIEQAGAGDAGTSFGLPVASGTTPSIVAAIPPPGGLSLTANGNILARLRKPRTLVLLVYSDQHGHQRLLGRVALGNHPAGLSRIKWGLRVDGHRLGAGGYLAELEGRLSGTALTTGGPTAGFQITHAGRLKIGRLSCSARTSTC